MLDEETWTVVKFVEEATVAAVPTKWIMEDKCLWPPYTAEKLNVAIKNQKFDTCWPSHSVQVFRNATFDSYEIARAKARKAEDTSDLSSTDADEGRTKRKHFIRRYSSSESVDEEYSRLPEMPFLLNKRNRTEIVPGTTPRRSAQVENQNGTPSGSQSGTPSENQSGMSITSRVAPSTSTMCNCCSSHASVSTEILKQLYFIKSAHNELVQEVRNLKGSNSLEEVVPDISVFSSLKIPCDTDEELIQIESFLKITDNFQKMVNELCKWGGSGILDFVKRCLGTIMTNKLATSYSWLGRRSKEGFYKFNLAAVIVESAIKSGKCNDKKIAEQEIARWLRRAGDRMKSFTKTTQQENN